MKAFTAIPVEARDPELLREMMAELDEIPGVLIVFNHPIWDLYRVGKDRHDVLVNEFLARYGQYVHALELNGLRHWKENREAATLAGKWNQLVISGGDRHGVEPNANVNLTRAESFTEFVYEVRRERQEPCAVYAAILRSCGKHRILAVDAGCDPGIIRIFLRGPGGGIRGCTTRIVMALSSRCPRFGKWGRMRHDLCAAFLRAYG